MIEGEGIPLLPARVPEQKYISAEIKPKEPGLLARSLSEDEKKQTPLDYLLVFGQGPVLDSETNQKPDPQAQNIKAEANSWMKTVARAAGELKLAEGVKKIVLTGGKTGGDNFPSEAQLMKNILISEYGINEADIIMEDQSGKTPENLAQSLNVIDNLKLKTDDNPSIGLLGADFHLPRIRLLAQLFGIDTRHSFSAEQIFKLIAERTDNQDMLQLINKRLNPNEDLSDPDREFTLEDGNAGSRTRITNLKSFQDLSSVELTKQPSKSFMKEPTLFELMAGEESKGVKYRMLGENWYTQNLLKVPGNWVGYLGIIKDDTRLLSVLKQFNRLFPKYLLKNLGISIDGPNKTSLEEIRNILEPYRKEKRVPLSSFENRKNWGGNARKKLEQLVDNR